MRFLDPRYLDRFQAEIKPQHRATPRALLYGQQRGPVSVESVAAAMVPKLDTMTLHLAHRITIGDQATGIYRRDAVSTYHRTVHTYTAPEPRRIRELLAQLFDELHLLDSRTLSDTAAIYHAAQLHVSILAIHPYEDGNGRLARFLERWYLAKHFGPVAHRLQNERYYRTNRARYFADLARMGNSFDRLEWYRALPVMHLLPEAIAHQLKT